MRIDASQIDYSVRQSHSEHRERALAVRLERTPRPAPPAPAAPPGGATEEAQDPRLVLLRLIVERMLGGRSLAPAPVNGPQVVSTPPAPVFTVSLSHREVYEEQESLVVAARGAVRTADGREIRFDAQFRLERSFRLESGATVRTGEAAVSDPLFLETASGQALLVRDQNGDGLLSGDHELFGARTGDGFAELAFLDADRNGWIDVGDPAFGELRLQFAGGALQALDALGIGALSVQAAPGEFQYKTADNELVAVVRSTGIYLTESGQVGAVRQIDLAV